jgi:hypothetical protein
MTSTPSPQSELQKPRSLTDREWQQLLHAVHSPWHRYVFDVRWLLTSAAAMAAGAFMSNLMYSRGEVYAGLASFFNSGCLTWGLGFLVFFRVLFYTIDWRGKRKLARHMRLTETNRSV